MQWRYLWAGVARKVFGDVGALCDRMAGLSSGLEIKEIKAIYWPAWRCSVSFQGKARVGGERAFGQSMVTAQNLYVPGQLPLTFCRGSS